MEANASLPKAEKRRNDYSGFSKTLFDRVIKILKG